MLDSGQRQEQDSSSASFWKSRTGMVFVFFLGIAGLLLVLEHSEHIFTGDGILIGLLLICIVMHLFMHGGHGGHGGHGTSDGQNKHVEHGDIETQISDRGRE